MKILKHGGFVNVWLQRRHDRSLFEFITVSEQSEKSEHSTCNLSERNYTRHETPISCVLRSRPSVGSGESVLHSYQSVGRPFLTSASPLFHVHGTSLKKNKRFLFSQKSRKSSDDFKAPWTSHQHACPWFPMFPAFFFFVSFRKERIHTGDHSWDRHSSNLN